MQVNFKGNTTLILFIKIQAQQGDFPHTQKNKIALISLQ